jgi:hypothetical protein
MFQYAAAVALQARIGGQIRFDLGWFEATGREAFRLHAFQLEAAPASQRDLSLLDDGRFHGLRRGAAGLARRAAGAVGLLDEPAAIVEVDEAHTPQLESLRPGSYLLTGTWQQPRLFQGLHARLAGDFQLRAPLSDAARAWRSRIAARPRIAVHVRRGDAFRGQYGSAIRSIGEAYYAEALAMVAAEAPDAEPLVFSDEPALVRRQLPQLAGLDFMDDLALEPHEVLALMCACQHFIIANSTLSWWAAWLSVLLAMMKC